MRSISRVLFLFAFVATPVVGTSSFLHASAQSVYNDRMTKVLHMPEEPVCKVLLAKDQKSFKVAVGGSHNIYDPYTGKKLEAAFLSSSYPLIPTTDGIQWGEDFPGVYQIVVVPDDEKTGITVNGVTYTGAVCFYQIEDSLAAVNWISLDDLTASLLSSYFLPRDAYQKEAIAAYAIAIRSLIHQHMMKAETPYWDVKSEECGYQGKTIARVDAPYNEAMKATKKIVLRGGVFPALTRKAIEEIRQKLPPQDIESMAKDGKDARVILRRFYPELSLGIAEKKPAAPNSYLK